MRRLLAIALPALLLLLAAPASAPAKGILGAKVCGSDGCKKVHATEHGLLGGGPKTDPPARGEPFVRLSIRVGTPGHSERVRLLFVLRSELVLADDGVTWMAPIARRELRAIARRVKPFAASKLPESIALGLAAAKAASAPLPPEIVEPPAPAAAAPGGGGSDRWLPAIGGLAILLAGAVVAGRRRRHGPRPAGATIH